MTYRPCPDPIDPPEPPVDTPEMLDEQASIVRGERQAAVLARLAEIGMALAEALLEQVKETPAADLAGAYAKIAQTVRRTLALEAHLAEGLAVRGAGLRAKRAMRKSPATSGREEKRHNTILEGLSSAIRERFPDETGPEHSERLKDVDSLLYEADEFADYLDRPVGEVIAELCKALGLDPDWAVQEDGEWLIKQPNFVPDLACHWPGAPRCASREIDPAPA